MDGKELPMIRKTFFAAAAAATLLGFGTIGTHAAAPIYSGAPVADAMDYKQDVRHSVVKCRTIRVKTDYGWKKVRKCRKVYPGHYGY
jgi:hypothetical protein